MILQNRDRTSEVECSKFRNSGGLLLLQDSPTVWGLLACEWQISSKWFFTY